MKKPVALSILTTLLWLFSVEVKSANSMVSCRTEIAQVAVERSEVSSKGKNKHKLGRRLLKQKIKVILEKAPGLSFGGAALLLLLSCLIVLLIMPGLAAFSLVLYVTALFLVALGMGRDKNKTPAFLALFLALLPVLWIAWVFIRCEIEGCFD